MAGYSDNIIDMLDDNPVDPTVRSKICHAIISRTNRRDALVNELMIEYEKGFDDTARLMDLKGRITTARSSIDQTKVAPLYHLAWGLLPEQTPLDGYLAEYYYEWAEAIGVPEKDVSIIISNLADLKGSGEMTESQL